MIFFIKALDVEEFRATPTAILKHFSSLKKKEKWCQNRFQQPRHLHLADIPLVIDAGTLVIFG
jgi:hypothetical protein